MVRVDVPQGVADGQGLVRLGQMRLPPGGPADPLPKGGDLRQFIVQLHRHRVVHIIKCHMLPPVLIYNHFKYILYSIAANLSIHRKKNGFAHSICAFYNIPPKVFSGSPSRPNPEPTAPAALLHCRDDPALSRIKIFRNHLLPSCNRIVLAFPPTVFYNIKQNRFRGTFS